MSLPRHVALLLCCLAVIHPASAQTPAAPPPPPLWDAQLGASFVGTSGNSDTASTHPEWTLDGVTSVAWLHESRTADAGVNDPIGVLQLLSRIPFGAAGDTVFIPGNEPHCFVATTAVQFVCVIPSPNVCEMG